MRFSCDHWIFDKYNTSILTAENLGSNERKFVNMRMNYTFESTLRHHEVCPMCIFNNQNYFSNVLLKVL